MRGHRVTPPRFPDVSGGDRIVLLNILFHLGPRGPHDIPQDPRRELPRSPIVCGSATHVPGRRAPRRARARRHRQRRRKSDTNASRVRRWVVALPCTSRPTPSDAPSCVQTKSVQPVPGDHPGTRPCPPAGVRQKMRSRNVRAPERTSGRDGVPPPGIHAHLERRRRQNRPDTLHASLASAPDVSSALSRRSTQRDFRLAGGPQ